MNDTKDDWKQLSNTDLVKRDICPAWLLPSDHILGRCIPKPTNSKPMNFILNYINEIVHSKA